MKINYNEWTWTRQPKDYSISEDKIEITTNPHTDLWQRTYYHFRNDNAPVLQMRTKEKFFSFVVKTEFPESHHRFDQFGIYACSPEDSSFKAIFTNMELTDCKWLEHNGQKADKNLI